MFIQGGWNNKEKSMVTMCLDLCAILNEQKCWINFWREQGSNKRVDYWSTCAQKVDQCNQRDL